MHPFEKYVLSLLRSGELGRYKKLGSVYTNILSYSIAFTFPNITEETKQNIILRTFLHFHDSINPNSITTLSQFELALIKIMLSEVMPSFYDPSKYFAIENTISTTLTHITKDRLDFFYEQGKNLKSQQATQIQHLTKSQEEAMQIATQAFDEVYALFPLYKNPSAFFKQLQTVTCGICKKKGYQYQTEPIPKQTAIQNKDHSAPLFNFKLREKKIRKPIKQSASNPEPVSGARTPLILIKKSGMK